MANALNLSTPKYVAPADWQSTSVTLSGPLPQILRTGTYVTSQSLLDGIVAASLASGIALVYLDAPPMGFTDERTQNPNAFYPTPAMMNELVGKATSVKGTPALLSRTVNKLGPISTDFTAVTINGTVDVTTYNKTYNLQSLANAKATPIEFANAIQTSSAGYDVGRIGSNVNVTRSIRFMLDGDKFAFYCGQASGLGVMIYIDGRPTALTPYTLATANYWNTVTFPSAKPRLIELVTAAPMLGIYTANPYTVSKPAPAAGPRVFVLGDSYVQGVGAVLTANAIYHNIAPMLGTEQVWIDGVGGTGYGVGSAADGSGANRYLDRMNAVTIAGTTEVSDIATIKPDLFVVHGGGINDLYKGRVVGQVVTDAITLFTQARAKLPAAKLVFVEGFAPAGFTPSVYNPNYIAIRQALQNALSQIGVYYVDVATTSPWIFGTGRVGATTGDGNADVYISADNAHPVDAGHLYIRARMAERLRRILNDNGTLLNSLV